MSKVHRVLNLTRNIRLKLKQAETAVEACSAVWVEYGVSIRDATLMEAIALRNQQAATRERLAYAELPWLRYEPSLGAQESYRREVELAGRANQFAQTQTAAG